MKPILFDFNGTLIKDADINKYAWKETINELSENKLNFEEFFPTYRSVRNNIFIEEAFRLIGKEISESEIEY